MLTHRYGERFGEDCFRGCDVVDMTFACIGAVDALHNTLDWVARGQKKKTAWNCRFLWQCQVRFGILWRIHTRSWGWSTSSSPQSSPNRCARPLGCINNTCSRFLQAKRSFDSVPINRVQLAAEAGATIKKEWQKPWSNTYQNQQYVIGIFAHGEENVKVPVDEPVFDGQFSTDVIAEAAKRPSCFTGYLSRKVWSHMDEILTSNGLESSCTLHMHSKQRECSLTCLDTTKYIDSWKQVEEEIKEMPEECDFETTEEWEKAMDGARSVSRLNLSSNSLKTESRRSKRPHLLVTNTLVPSSWH